MRESRVVKVALPLLAGAVMVGGVAVPASARNAHYCAKTSAFAKKLVSFEKAYEQGVLALAQPKSKSFRAFATYFDRATTFFDSQTQLWARVVSVAPLSVRVSVEESLNQLGRTSTDFANAGKAIRSANLPAAERNYAKAVKVSNVFIEEIPALIKQCSST